MLSQLDVDFHGSPITAEAERDRASGRHFTNETAKLLFTFNRCPVEVENHIVLAKTGFAGGSIGVHHGDFHATLFFQLERSHAVTGNVANINAQIRPACWGVKEVFNWVSKPPRLPCR